MVEAEAVGITCNVLVMEVEEAKTTDDGPTSAHSIKTNFIILIYLNLISCVNNN